MEERSNVRGGPVIRQYLSEYRYIFGRYHGSGLTGCTYGTGAEKIILK